jgi:hypothetical protein
MESQAMKCFVILFLSTLAFTQDPKIREEHWGMTQDEVIAAEVTAPRAQWPFTRI